MANPTAQAVGIVAYFFSAYSVYQKDEYRLRLFMSISAFVWVLHHFLLHSYTAAILLLVIAVRCYLSSAFLEKSFNYRLRVAITFIIINALCTYFAWEGSVSLFAFSAATVATISVLLTTGFWTRVLLISVEAMWLAYNIHVLSIGGIIACLTDGLIMTFVLYKDFIKKEEVLRLVKVNA